MPDINNIGTEENTIIPASEKEALAKKKEEFHKQEQSGDSYTQLVKKQFKKNKLAVASVYLVFFLVLVAIFADFLAYEKPLYVVYKGETYLPVFKDYMVDLGLSKWEPPDLYNIDWKELDDAGKLESVVWAPVPYGPNEINLTTRLLSPGGDHYLGTDAIGRDLLAGLIHGSRISLSVGFVAAGIAVLIGVILGSFAGYYGGKVDLIISRFIEIMLNFPTFFLIIVIVAIYGSSIWFVMLAIGFTTWTTEARLIRGEILKVRNMEYILAANSVGLPNGRIIFRHVLPNSIAPVLVSGAFAIAGAIILEAGLSFLGVGVSATTVTWGSLVNEGRVSTNAWWLAIFPGLMIFIAVVSYNLIGEGLRDALDPRLKD
ncbi:MAG: ABC transporter permease [Ignavibacteriae bacterium]|nr:ABC transporter permease [Ignavibacteriota bacterium]MCB9242659.1 ABC transporter permease [Ignavibacteriales bacterium]